jgi:hypothetical protein
MRYKGHNLGQRIWDKVRCYWENVEELKENLGKHVENLLGTWWDITSPLLSFLSESLRLIGRLGLLTLFKHYIFKLIIIFLKMFSSTLHLNLLDLVQKNYNVIIA